ncbi:MAG: carbohydrate ABC transporter permease [Acholeplasma sp.]|nr:carbohydrate ABC transporter permease [Acholeplasma sp.]
MKKMTKSRLSLYAQRALIYTVLSMLTILIIFLFYTLIVNASRAHADIQKSFSLFFGKRFGRNFENLLDNKNINVLNAMKNSMIIASLSAIFTTYVSALTAYGIHLYNFKGRKFIYLFILAVMMIPSQIANIGLVTILYGIGLVDNFAVIILPSLAAPATFFFIKQYLDSVLPFEVVESGRVDGAKELRIFHQIVLPMIKPALAVQFIFSFVASWNNFFLPSLVIQSPDKRTIPIVISLLKNSSPDTFDLGPVYMFMVLAIVPMLIVYLIFSRQIIKGVTLGSVKG